MKRARQAGKKVPLMGARTRVGGPLSVANQFRIPLPTVCRCHTPHEGPEREEEEGEPVSTGDFTT